MILVLLTLAAIAGLLSIYDWLRPISPLMRLNRMSRAPLSFAEESLPPPKRASKSITPVIFAFYFLASSTGAIFGSLLGGLIGGIIGLGLSGYLSCVIQLSIAKVLKNRSERNVLLELPVILESLILLVDSGLGLLPALQRVVSEETKANPARYIFRLVYDLSSGGMPLSEALEYVSEKCAHPTLRHVLLHLDISGTEGGALVPSLRSLAHHAHLEWKMSVEMRVRRLENLVVFPVFGSVIGLILLTAAVPLIPLMQLKEHLDQAPEIPAPNENFQYDSQL